MPNKPVTLYLDHSAPPTVVPVSQGDTDWTYVFTVMNNGEVYSPDVTYVIITGHKPDGNVFAFLGSKSGSRYQLVANGQLVQMTAVPGDVPCELRLMKNGRSIGTTNFILRVEPGPEGVVTVASASALPAYVTILNQLAGIMAQAESIPSDIGGYISDWLAEHISGGQGVAVDDTLTIQGAAADSKKVGDELATVLVSLAAILGIIADSYSDSATYAVGDYCIHDAQLYRCTTSISTAEAWTAAHWTAVTLDDCLRALETAQIETDDTLTTEGAAADAKAVGDRFGEVDADIADLTAQFNTQINGIGAQLDAINGEVI